MKKKILSLMLVISMFLGVFASASAASYKPVTAIESYVDTNDTWVAVLVNQPYPDNRKVVNLFTADVGHTILAICSGDGEVQYVGFHPHPDDLPSLESPEALRRDCQGILLDDSDEKFNIGYKVEVSRSQIRKLVSYINNDFDTTYNIEDNNCTTFAAKCLKKIGVSPVFTKHNWTVPLAAYIKDNSFARAVAKFFGYTPADAGVDVKNSSNDVITYFRVNQSGMLEGLLIVNNN